MLPDGGDCSSSSGCGFMAPCSPAMAATPSSRPPARGYRVLTKPIQPASLRAFLAAQRHLATPSSVN